MKRICLIGFLCILSGMVYAQETPEKPMFTRNRPFYQMYQSDIDVVRMHHFDYYVKLLDEYYQKKHSYPFQDLAIKQSKPVYVFVLNEAQQQKFKDENPYPHITIEAKDLFKELENVLGIQVEEKYDPHVPFNTNHSQSVYTYMVTKNEVYFVVHLYTPNKFTKKASDHYTIQFSNTNDEAGKLFTYKILQQDPEYQQLLSKQPKRKKHTDKKTQGKN